MKQKIYELPKHPLRGPQRIIIEKDLYLGMWVLVLNKNKARPLPGLEKPPKTAKEVLDKFKAIYGESNVAQFVMQGYSKC